MQIHVASSRRAKSRSRRSLPWRHVWVSDCTAKVACVAGTGCWNSQHGSSTTRTESPLRLRKWLLPDSRSGICEVSGDRRNHSCSSPASRTSPTSSTRSIWIRTAELFRIHSHLFRFRPEACSNRVSISTSAQRSRTSAERYVRLRS